MISIIVPCYNSDLYILNCIESVRGQTYKEWELIIVDDSSTDDSWKVCKRISEEDQRVILLKNTGHGVSSARNTGIKHAKGEYICFVDADDWLEANALESMITGAGKAQITSASYQKKYDNGEVATFVLGNETVDRNSFIISLFDSRKIYQGYCWAKLFETNIIKKNNIFFDTELAYNEDRLFVLEYAMHIDRAIYSSTILYNYRQHNESAMSLARNSLKIQSIYNEIESSNKIKKLLNGRYPAGQAWMNYNLLKKAYRWKHEVKKQDNVDSLVVELINELSKDVWLSRDINVFSKLKLIKSKFFDWNFYALKKSSVFVNDKRT